MTNKFKAGNEEMFEPEPMDADLAPARLERERLGLAVRILKETQESLRHAIELLDEGDLMAGREALATALAGRGEHAKQLEELQAGRVVEGVFDGENMIGSDGERYPVSANYASKSKLVEGDMLKLTIRPDGNFVYKQIGPIERQRVEARIAWNASAGSWVAMDKEHDRVWKILNASVSWFRGQEGDTAFVLIPKTAPSTWAAVESIVRG